ncbi:hypothetical protein TRVA0_010S02454 [Trichomonascus vanleenenianus]|uniref:deubiquitinase OTU2 n=1 Tax=Trichomonascus vanleenenianus TaxID=2268995 RepID=UPI003ECA4324
MTESEEQMLARHRKEAKDLIATTTGMKKQATKKTRKGVMKKIEEMEADLKRRHADELKSLDGQPAESANEVNGEQEPEEEEDDAAKLLAQLALDIQAAKEEPKADESQPIEEDSVKPKRNRRKEKLAKRQQEIDKIREQAAAEAELQPDLRKIELENITKICDMQNLVQYDIVPDGHCLFASIADQLQQRHSLSRSVQELRSEAAGHIRENPNDFAPFLFDEETLTMKEIEPYCKELESTAIWGGDMEILALSNIYNCPISVLFSGRSPHKVNTDAPNPELRLVYYKHSYGLGEHYNSLRDK